MDRVIAPGSVAFVARDLAPTSGTPGYFTAGNPATATPATVLPGYFLNMLQDEMLAVITGAGLTLDGTNWGQLAQAIRSFGRIRLTAPLNLYVSNAGSDANDGLTAATPQLTLQRAWSIACTNYDFGSAGHIQINLAAGTYTVGLGATGYPTGSGVINIVGGSLTNPGLTTINVGNGNCLYFGAGVQQVNLQGIRLVSTGTASTFNTVGSGILAASGGNAIYFNNVDFGPCGQAHVYAANGALISSASGAANSVPYTISGGAPYHALAGTNGTVNLIGCAITLAGTPAFSSSFLCASEGSLAFVYNSVMGSATGSRYVATLNGVLNTAGGYTSLPGSTPGSYGSGGLVV